MLLLGIVVLGCLAGGVWALRHVRFAAAPPPPQAPLNSPGMSLELKKVRIFGVSEGKIIWEVEADHFDISKYQPITRMTGLRRVAVLDAKKQEALTLTAGYLERNNISNNLSLLDNVTVIGPQMTFNTGQVDWDATSNLLVLPRALTARVGEYDLTAQGPTTYNVQNGQLITVSPVQLTSGGNVLRAAGASVMTKEQSFSLTGPGTAELQVADMEGWLNGRPLPKIPEIPEDIRKRYAAYQKSHAARPFGGMSPPGGVW
jgi:hypothetical protein